MQCSSFYHVSGVREFIAVCSAVVLSVVQVFMSGIAPYSFGTTNDGYLTAWIFIPVVFFPFFCFHHYSSLFLQGFCIAGCYAEALS